MDEGWIVLIMFTWLFMILGGTMIGDLRGRAGPAAALALFLGPLGLIIGALLPRTAENEARYRLDVERELEIEKLRRERAEVKAKRQLRNQQTAEDEAAFRRWRESET